MSIGSMHFNFKLVNKTHTDFKQTDGRGKFSFQRLMDAIRYNNIMKGIENAQSGDEGAIEAAKLQLDKAKLLSAVRNFDGADTVLDSIIVVCDGIAQGNWRTIRKSDTSETAENAGLKKVIIEAYLLEAQTYEAFGGINNKRGEQAKNEFIGVLGSRTTELGLIDSKKRQQPDLRNESMDYENAVGYYQCAIDTLTDLQAHYTKTKQKQEAESLNGKIIETLVFKGNAQSKTAEALFIYANNSFHIGIPCIEFCLESAESFKGAFESFFSAASLRASHDDGKSLKNAADNFRAAAKAKVRQANAYELAVSTGEKFKRTDNNEHYKTEAGAAYLMAFESYKKAGKTYHKISTDYYDLADICNKAAEECGNKLTALGEEIY